MLDHHLEVNVLSFPSCTWERACLGTERSEIACPASGSPKGGAAATATFASRRGRKTAVQLPGHLRSQVQLGNEVEGENDVLTFP